MFNHKSFGKRTQDWPFVSIITVNLNGRIWLENCLKSIFQSDYPLSKMQIILVDNGSTDDSVNFVKREFPTVKIISLNKNCGYAQGNNMGFKSSTGDLILLLNNDTILRKNTLKIMINEIEKIKDAGILQPKIILTGNRGLDACGAFLTNTGFLYHYGIGENPKDPAYNKKIPVFSVKGACMLVKREVIGKIQLFDDDFFAYFEESDFCHRAWIAGYRVYYAPKAVMYHKRGATAEKLGQEKIPPWLHFHSYKNRICSHIKNLSSKELIKMLPMHLSLVSFLSILYFVRGEPEVSRAIYRSLWWNLTNLKKTLRKRKYIQKKLRLIDDAQVMKIIKKNIVPNGALL
jgi:GT2 family glycosyltransferase